MAGDEQTNDGDQPVAEDEAAQSPDAVTTNGPRAERLAKIQALTDAGIDVHPYKFDRTATAGELHTAHPDLAPDSHTGTTVRVAGRLGSIRAQGFLSFATLHDESGDIQLFFERDQLVPEAATVLEALDTGDWVGAEGEVVTTRRGELSIEVTQLWILTKSLHPLDAAPVHHRSRRAGPPPRARPRHQPRHQEGLRHPDRPGRRPPRPAAVRRLRGGRDPDPAGPGGWGHRPPLPDPLQRPRHRPVAAHRPRAVPEATRGGRLREGLRARSRLPQRGHRHPPQPRVHGDGGLHGPRRLPRRHGPHRAPHRDVGPGRRRPPRLPSGRHADRPVPRLAPALAARPHRGGRRPAAAPLHGAGRGPTRCSMPTASSGRRTGAAGS